MLVSVSLVDKEKAQIVETRLAISNFRWTYLIILIMAGLQHFPAPPCQEMLYVQELGYFRELTPSGITVNSPPIPLKVIFLGIVKISHCQYFTKDEAENGGTQSQIIYYYKVGELVVTVALRSLGWVALAQHCPTSEIEVPWDRNAA